MMEPVERQKIHLSALTDAASFIERERLSSQLARALTREQIADLIEQAVTHLIELERETANAKVRLGVLKQAVSRL